MSSSSRTTEIDLVGKKIGVNYDVLGELGRGTYGTVYECRDTSTNQNVAIKATNPEYAHDELKAFESLENVDEKCNYLIEILDGFMEDDLACLVYPVYGPNLKEAMFVNNQPFELQDVRVMAKQLIKATNFLHKNGMMHSDIKPENILLNRFYYDQTKKDCFMKPNIKLCDLGSVYWEEEFDYDVITTLPYRAPDVIMGHKVGYPCDVWSIGCTLFELFTGKLLFEVKSVQELFRLIHLMISHFNEDEVENINRKLSEDGENVDLLNEKELAKMRSKVKVIESYFDRNNNGEKVLLQLITLMLDLNPVTRVKLKDIV